MASDATQILMLHRIRPDEPVAFGLPECYRLRGTALTIDELERTLAYCAPLIALDAIEGALTAGAVPPPGMSLTFDDGFREHLDVVAPLLVSQQVTATFYVATGLHGASRRVALVDAWYWLLDHAERAAATVPMPDGTCWHGRLDTVDHKKEWVGGRPKAALLSAPPTLQASMLAALAESTAVDPPGDVATQLYLRPDEWQTLAALGMRVGAHSVTHPRLNEVDDEMCTQEIERSVEAVAGLGAPVSFAYPDGAFDAAVIERVRHAGCASAVTCEPGTISPGADLLRLPRVFVSPAWVAKTTWRPPAAGQR